MMRASEAQRDLVRGKVSLEAGDASSAVEALTAALRREPRLTLARFHRGEAYASLGRWREALKDFDGVLAEEPGHLDSRFQRGLVFSRMGRRALAEKEFALARRQGSAAAAQARAKEAEALMGAGKLEEARDILDRVLERFPGGDARVLRGIVRRLLGDVEGAVADFRQALELSNRELWNRAFGEEEYRRIPDERARADFARLRELVRRDPRDAAAAALLGIAAHRLGFLDEGREALLAAARAHPPSAEQARDWAAKHLCWSAEARVFNADSAEAFRLMEEALRLSRNAAWVRAWRGQLSLWLGRYGDALRDLDAALDASSPRYTPGSSGWAYAWRGAAKLKLGRAEAGLADIDRAIELQPRDPEAHVWRAEALLARGRGEDALASARRGQELRPDSLWPRLIRAALGGKGAASALGEAFRLCPRLAAAVPRRVAAKGPAFAARAALELAAGNRSAQPTCVLRKGGELLAVFKPVIKEARVSPALEAAREAALRVDPDRGWVYAWKENPLLGRAEHERLLAAARRAGNGAETLAIRGELERKLGSPKAALAALDRALALDGASACARAWRGEALRDLSRHGEAREELGRAAALAPEAAWIQALAGRAWIDFTPEHLERAVAALDRALALSGRRLGWMLAWRGEALRRLKRHEEALRDLSDSLKLGAPPAWTLTCRAEVRRKLGDFKGALKDLDEALRFSPGYAWVHVTRSEVSRKRRRYPEAIAHLEAAVAASRGAGWAYALLGRAQANFRFPKEGLANLGRALRRDPLAGWAWAWRGEVLRRLGRPRAALRDFDRALRLDPDYGWAWAWRGGVLRQLGRLRVAARDLDQAARLQPHYPWALAERSRVRRDLGDVVGAMDDLERAMRMDSKYSWLEHPSQAARALGALDRHLAARPRDGRALAWRGRTRAELGDAAGALADLERAVAIDPQAGLARAWRGEALTMLGRGKDALADLDTAARLEPGSPRTHAWRGRALAQAGRPARALASLDRAIAIEPRSAWAFFWRAELRAARGDRAGARADLDDALGLHPGFAQARALREAL